MYVYPLSSNPKHKFLMILNLGKIIGVSVEIYYYYYYIFYNKNNIGNINIIFSSVSK
jgi:hypothetical protein